MTDLTTATSPEQVRTGWDRIAGRFDRSVTPWNTLFAGDALRRAGLAPGMRLLDVGTGTGALAIAGARMGAEVLGVDIAPAMVSRLAAWAAEEGLGHLEARAMDGQDLDLPDAGFELVASQHGVSLFPDAARGLAEMARVTRPGGKAVVVAFGPPPRSEFISFVLGALQAAVPGFRGLPSDPPPLPFQFADPGRLRAAMEAAGLVDAAVEAVTWHLPVATAADLWTVFTSSNPIGQALVADLSPSERGDALEVLDGMLAERAQESGFAWVTPGRPAAVLGSAVNIGIGTR